MRQFKCGHEGPAPEYMGKGARREQRLTEYFNRTCHACAIIRQRDFAAKLTRIDGTRYTLDEQGDYIRRHPIKVY